MYGEMFDGLRGYYCSFPGERKFAGFSAAMALSFLFNINLFSVAVLSMFVSGRMDYLPRLAGNKILLLIAGTAIAVAHVQFAKATGRYTATDPPPSARWKWLLIVYGGITISLVVGAMMAVFASRVEHG